MGSKFDTLKYWKTSTWTLAIFRIFYVSAGIFLLGSIFYFLYMFWPNAESEAKKIQGVAEVYRNIGLVIAGALALWFAWLRIQKLDEQNRELIQKKEALEKEKKDISKSKDKAMFKRSKELPLDLEKISENQKNEKSELDIKLSNIHNIDHYDVHKVKEERKKI